MPCILLGAGVPGQDGGDGLNARRISTLADHLSHGPAGHVGVSLLKRPMEGA